MEQRKELAYERHTLPARFWEPEPDEEDIMRMMMEAEEKGQDEDMEPDMELPFI